MSNNTDGYTDYVDYTYGYYPYWTQAGLKLAAVQRGIQPVEIKNACELGFGQGVTLNLLASASDVKWYGTDFNSNHAKFADDLAKNKGCQSPP